MTYMYEHKVQYYETDQMQCVHHSNYIRWFEEARTYLLDKVGFGYAQMEAAGVMSPVVAAQAAYRSMVRFGETVDIEVWVAAYTGTRITFRYVVRDRETKTLRVEGETRHCFLRTEGGRPVSLKKQLPALDGLMRGQQEDDQSREAQQTQRGQDENSPA